MQQVIKGLELYYSYCESYPINVSNYNVLGKALVSSPLMNSLGTNASNGCGNNQGSRSIGNGGFGNAAEGIDGQIFARTINVSPLPIDPSGDPNNGCNWSHSTWGEAVWNDYVYLATDESHKRFLSGPPPNNKAANYRLYFCLGEKVGTYSAGRYMAYPPGIKKCTTSDCGFPID